MIKPRSMVVYPILFGLYPFLNLYASNLGRGFHFSEFLLPIGLTLIVTVAVWVALSLVWKNAAKAAFVCFVAQILFFAYGHVYDALVDDVGWKQLNDTTLLIVWLILFVAALIVTLKWGQRLSEISGPLNVVAAVLVIFPLITIARFDAGEDESVFQGTPNAQGNYGDLLGEPFKIQPQATGYGDELPDIYYIILDGYPREDVLREFYGYDNSAFSNRLRDLGFYVADKSQANYINTSYSLVSSLDANYIQNIFSPEDLKDKPWFYLDNLIGKNVMCPTLKSIGYYHIEYDNTAAIFSNSPCADMVRRYVHLDQLDTILLQTTLLRPVLAKTVTDSYRQAQQFIFSDLPNVARLPQPTFTYAHILLPHPPLVFDRNGGPLDIPNDKYWLTPGSMSPELQDAFLGQTIYTTEQIQHTIEQILANSDVPPIIILQSDHGSFPPVEDTFGWRYLRERVPNFNAYFLPKGGEDLLYPTITPVNSFRVVLNYYFGANLPYLEDISYHNSLFGADPFDFVDVTRETIYQDDNLTILRTWDGDTYQVRRITADGAVTVAEFPAQTLTQDPGTIAGKDGWSVTLTTENTSHYVLSLYDPQDDLVGSGSIDTNDADMHRYDLNQQDYYDFASYRDSAAPLVPADQQLVSPDLSLEAIDADVRSIGSYISLTPDLTPDDKAPLYDLMLLLDRARGESQLPPEAERPAILAADYVLLKDSGQWRQDHTEDWFLLFNPAQLELVTSWNITIADRLEPVQYDLYRVIASAEPPAVNALLPDLYASGTPILVSTPAQSLNTVIQRYLLADIPASSLFDLTGLGEDSPSDKTLAQVKSFVGDADQFWYIGTPEEAASEPRLMEYFASLGYLRGRMQPLDPGLYYSTLRVFSYHRVPAMVPAQYTFGDEQIGLYAWSLDGPEPVVACQTVRLQTWWISQNVPQQYYRMSIALIDPDGQRAMQDDLELSEVMMTEWQAGDPYLDERWLPLPCDLGENDYDLVISVYAYDYATQSIVVLPATSAGGDVTGTVGLLRFHVSGS